MIQTTAHHLQVAGRIISVFRAQYSPDELIKKINKLPYYPKTVFNSLSSFTNDKWMMKENSIVPIKHNHCWRKPLFNLKKQSLFIEYSESLGLDPYLVYPNLRLLRFKKAPVELVKDVKNTAFEVEKIEENKEIIRQKRRDYNKSIKSPLEGRTQ